MPAQLNFNLNDNREENKQKWFSAQAKPEATPNHNSTNVINLARLKSTQGFTINAEENDRRSVPGSVSDAGDINNDGIDDIMISRPGADVDGKEEAGKVYVIFGKEELSNVGNIDVRDLDGSNGFAIKGVEEFGQLGRSISNVGDVNDDGVDDIVISATGINVGSKNFGGNVFVIFGDSQIGNSGKLKTSELDGSKGFAIESDETFSQTGFSVSDAGDFNHDGVDDLIIATSASKPQQIAKDYVIFGDSQLGKSGTFNLLDVNGSNGVAIVDRPNRHLTNINFVGSAGDINDDDIDDVIIGSPVAGNNTVVYGKDSVISGRPNSGRGYVVFGREDFDSNKELDISSLSEEDGLTIEIDSVGGFLGRSVGYAGDLNNDGVDDVAIGGTLAGSHVIFGNRDLSSIAKIDANTLDGTNGFSVLGNEFDDLFGSSVSNAGDFNGDGIDDFAVAAPSLETSSHAHGGAGYIIFGKADFTGFDSSLKVSQLSTNDVLVLKDFGNFVYNYHKSLFIDTSSNNFISNAGDINGDGIDDLIIGQPGVSIAADSYVIFGSREYGNNTFQSSSLADDLSINSSLTIHPAFTLATSAVLFSLILFKVPALKRYK